MRSPGPKASSTRSTPELRLCACAKTEYQKGRSMRDVMGNRSLGYTRGQAALARSG
jgi:hypothetical protein